MTIAFDIDGTWDLDTASFGDIAMLLSARGWTVLVVTGSHQPHEKLMRLGIAKSIEEIYGGNQPILKSYIKAVIIKDHHLSKKESVERRGYKVDVWVDNEPWLIAPEQTLLECKDEQL